MQQQLLQLLLLQLMLCGVLHYTVPACMQALQMQQQQQLLLPVTLMLCGVLR
jgi:hypothetical protein